MTHMPLNLSYLQRGPPHGLFRSASRVSFSLSHSRSLSGLALGRSLRPRGRGQLCGGATLLVCVQTFWRNYTVQIGITM